jgi:GNAT superfamily N-acetyltransferase
VSGVSGLPRRFVLAAPVHHRPCADDPGCRPPRPADAQALAALFHAAWRGTVDDEGETLADWQARVAQYLAGEFGLPMWAVSEVCAEPASAGTALQSAVLVGLWHQQPLVVFVATAPGRRRQGLARAGLTRTLNRLAAGDEAFARLVLTEGNSAAMDLYESLGFRPEGAPIQGPP